MKILSSKNLKRSIAFGFSVALLILIAISLISYKNIKELEEVTGQINKSYIISEKAANVYADVQDMVSASRGYVLAGTGVYMEIIFASKNALEEDFAELKILMKDLPEHNGKLARLDSLIKLRTYISEQVINVRNEKGLEGALAFLQQHKGNTILKEIKEAKDEIVNAERSKLIGKTEQEIETSSDTEYALLFGSLVSLLFMVASFVIITNDIDKRNEVAAELRKSEKLYRTLIKNFPDGSITLYDKDLRYVIADGLGLREIGQTSEIVEGKRIEETLPAESYKLLEPYYKGVFRGETNSIEVPLQDKIYQTTIVPLKNEKDEVEGGIVISQNITKWKKAEEELRNSETIYRTIMENFPNGTVTIYDKKLNTILVGGGGLEPLNLTKSMAEKRHLSELLPPDEFDRIKGDLLKVFEDIPTTFEINVYGIIFYVSNIAFKNEKGEIIGGLSISQNITQLKENEKKINKQTNLVRLLQDIAIAANEAGSVEEAMKFSIERICSYTGWPLGHVFLINEAKEEFESTKLWCFNNYNKYEDFIKATDLITFKKGIGLPGRVLEEKNPVWINNISEDKNFPQEKIAETFELKSAFGFPVFAGTEVVGVMEFFTDKEYKPDEDLLNILTSAGTQIGRIVERKRAENILKTSESALENAQSIAHLGNWEWNVKDNALKWSEEMYRIYGLDSADGAPTYEEYISYIHPEDRNMLTSMVENAYKTCEPFETSHRINRKDGSERILLCKGRVVTDKDGNVSSLIGIGHDITELKVAEQNLIEINKKLTEAQNELINTEKMAAIGRISSSMAHEIRNPLANISAASQILINRNKEDEKLIAYLDIILRNTETANRIIKELLDFASPREISLKEGDIVRVVNNVCTLISPRCTQENVKLDCSIELDELKLAKINEKKLEEALMNFTTNAIDAMHGGGVLSLLLNKEVASDEVSLVVADTGEGIPVENMDKIFEPFFTTKSTGTGLGMSLAHQIIKAHNGKLVINSTPGKGTRIEIMLPIS